MRLLFVADGRSPIALGWIRHFAESGHEVHLVSTAPCQPPFPLASRHVVPVAFSGRRAAQAGGRRIPGRITGSVRLRTLIRQWLGPLTLNSAAEALRPHVERIRPELVHALRIPFEGMLAAAARPPAPLLLSVWGNDFTLHATASPALSRRTREALERADGLHADCVRDLRLAQEWGFSEQRPTIVAPGNGGVRMEIFHPRAEPTPPEDYGLTYLFSQLPREAPVVVNPRGLRAYVRTDAFFRSIPPLRARHPSAQILLPATAGEPEPLRWLDQLKIREGVHLLPKLSPHSMAAVFRRADVSVSPSEHDGTPNTLLEAMACGAFPIAGDIESIREWIEHGVNGLLVDPSDPVALAQAVALALDDAGLRARAAAENLEQVERRARYETVMQAAEAFYRRLIG